MTITEAKPVVEFDHKYPGGCDAYRHEDGSITYIVFDDDSEHANPRNNDGNVATLIQCNDRCIDLDRDSGGYIDEARDRWRWTDYASMPGGTFSDRAVKKAGRQTMVERYLAMFQPEVLHFEDYWSAGDCYGWGFVTREAWVKWMGEDYDGPVTPKEAFDSEVRVFGLWATGEVYGAVHVSVGEPIVVYGDHGAYVDGYKTEEESCWGFLGYDGNQQIAEQMTESPVTEVLA